MNEKDFEFRWRLGGWLGCDYEQNCEIRGDLLGMWLLGLSRELRRGRGMGVSKTYRYKYASIREINI